MVARFILSKSKVIEQYNTVKQLGRVSYSFKTNPLVGKVLEDGTDCLFSIHFENELKLISDRSRVIFLAQALSFGQLEKLSLQGVNKFVVENTQDLDILLDFIGNKKISIELLLRMKLRENTIRTERHYVFGMDSAQVNRLCIGLKKNPFIKKLGVHFHRKTQNTSEWNLVGEFSELVSEEALACISIVNIGGGLPVLYKNTTDKAVPCAFERIEEFKEYLSERRVELIIEPGRFISAPAVKLEAKILLVHDNTIVVDASVYNSSIDTLIVPVKLLVEGELPDSAEQKGNPYLIKGITPCSTDLFRYRVYLKQAPRKGDALLFLNAGSYNFHTEFCELEKIKTVLVD